MEACKSSSMINGISLKTDDEAFDDYNGVADESSLGSQDNEANEVAEEGYPSAQSEQIEPKEEEDLMCWEVLLEESGSKEDTFHVESPNQIGGYIECTGTVLQLDGSKFEAAKQEELKLEEETRMQFDSAYSDTLLKVDETENMNHEEKENREDSTFPPGTPELFGTYSDCSMTSLQSNEAKMEYSDTEEDPKVEDASSHEATSDTSLQEDNGNVKIPFLGFSDFEIDNMNAVVDRKSEQIYEFRKSRIKSYYKAVFTPRNGFIRIPSKGLKAYLIHPTTCERMAKFSRRTNPEQRTKKNKYSGCGANKEPNLVEENIASVPEKKFGIHTVPKQSQKMPMSRGRNIKTPKRYLNGVEEKTLKPVKRKNPSKPALDKNEYQIGMLHPKYPKYMETYDSNISNKSQYLQRVNAYFQQQRASDNHQVQDNPLNGLFAISQMHYSGEMEQVLLEHKIEQVRQFRQQQLKEVLEQKRLEEEEENARLEAERLRQDKEIIERMKVQKELKLQQLLLQKEREAEWERAQVEERTSYGANKRYLKDSISKFFETQRAGKSMGCVRCLRCGVPNTSLLAMSQVNEYYCSECSSPTGPSSPSELEPAISITPVSMRKKNYVSQLPAFPGYNLTGLTIKAHTLRKASRPTSTPAKAKKNSTILPFKNRKKIQATPENPVQLKSPLLLPKMPMLTGKAFQQRMMISPSHSLCPTKKLHQKAIQAQSNLSQSSAFNQTLFSTNISSNSKQLVQQEEGQTPWETTLMQPPPPLQVIPQQSRVVSYGNEKFIVLEEPLTEEQCVESLLRRGDITVWKV